MKPIKKIAETDAIFAHVAESHAASAKDPSVLRLSIDSKAKVKIGNLSRNGKARALEAPKADDHDEHWDAVLVPFGILDVEAQQLFIYFGQSAETSDFIVDCLELWWDEHQADYAHIKTLAIDLDGGPSVRSNRTQFIKRMVQFVQTTTLNIELVYYPPYHSKYNAIERCWGALENYWNGTLLTSVETALRWAANMTWNGFNPIVRLVEGQYSKGVSLTKQELIPWLEHWHRHDDLPKWAVTISP